MYGQNNGVDAFGRNIGVKSDDYVPVVAVEIPITVEEIKDSDRYNKKRSLSRSRSRQHSHSRSHSSRPRHHKNDWIVPTNPLSRTDEEPHKERKHKRHHHHRRHRHRSRSTSRSRSRSRSHIRRYETVADKKERWGHELFVEKVILNPEPEPPRNFSQPDIPQEKWISKAGGVAIFTSRPTSASSYQGRRDY